jgi:hypothetical protein
LRWYETGLGREQFGLAREIEEEFLEMGANRIKQFIRRPEFVLEREVREGPIAVPSHGYWQCRFFQVLQLEEQSEASKKLATSNRMESKKNPHMVLVTSEEIRQGRLKDGRLIGDSCGYLFSHLPEGAPPTPRRHSGFNLPLLLQDRCCHDERNNARCEGGCARL